MSAPSMPGVPCDYKVAALWWPSGWEPRSPWDMPQCVALVEGGVDPQARSCHEAFAIVEALNRQALDHAATCWYAVIAVEKQPVRSTVSYEPSGLQTASEVRRFRVVRPDRGGRGDCSHCPAAALDCAESWPPETQHHTTTLARTAAGRQ